MLWRLLSRVVALALILGACAAAVLVSGCGAGSDQAGAEASAPPASATKHTALVSLPTRKCKTDLGGPIKRVSFGPRTQVVIPSSIAAGLVAYRDAAGTTLIAPKGWECEAGIGSDQSERINAFPPGHEDPAEPPFRPGEVVSLQLYTACARCAAEVMCALFPTAKIVKRYGVLGGPNCPAEGLPEQVTHISPATAVFFDRPGAEATGTGSGGRAPSVGALSYSEASGMRKVSCTLAAQQADVCAGIIGATMLAAPF